MATNTEKVVVQVIVKGGKQLDALTKKATKATKSAGGLTKQFAKMAAKTLAAAAAFRLIVKVVSDSIKTFSKFEFQMAKVRAITGASSTDFLKLSESAEELGRTTFFTATEVAGLQTNYAKLGFTTKEILKAQEATLLLATATGSDLARAAIVAGAAVRGFGLNADETGRVTDVMTMAFASSALDIEKWQTSMTKVAPIAAGMNIPLEETAAIMGTLTDAGIEASIAGTSMRNIFLQMKNPASKLAKFLGFTVHSADDLSKAMTKLTTASDDTLDGLVKVRQVAAFNVMVKGAARVANLTDKLNNAQGSAKEMAGIVGDDLQGAFKRLTSAWEGFMINFTESTIGKRLQSFTDGVARMVNVVSDFVDIPMSEKLEENRIKLNSMVLQLTQTNIKEKDRLKLIIKIKKEYPKFLENIDTEKTSTKELKNRLREYNDQLINKILLQKEDEKLNKISGNAANAKEKQMKAESRLQGALIEVSEKHNIALKDGATTAEHFAQVKEILKKQDLGFSHTEEAKSLKKLTPLVIRSGWANQKLKEYTDELNVATQDRNALAEQLGLNLDSNIEDGEEETEVIEEVTDATKELTKAREELDSSFISTASDEYWNSLMEDVLNGTKTMKEQEQELANFQMDLINNLLLDETLSYDERIKLQKQLTALKLDGINSVADKQKETDAAEIERKEANIEIMKTAGGAILDIMQQNADRQLQQESKRLEEKKDAGLISQEEYEKGIEQIERAAFEKKKKRDSIQVIMDTAMAVAKVFAQTGVWGFAAMAPVIAVGAAQLAVIQSQKFANGGMIEEFANGGMVQGKSHAQGGEKFAVGGRVVELEGGEAVINKRSTAMFSSQLSAMNAAGGGVKFADGGLLNQPSFSQQQFNALGQNQMMGAMGSSSKVIVVEADITSSQNTVSVIQSQATI